MPRHITSAEPIILVKQTIAILLNLFRFRCRFERLKGNYKHPKTLSKSKKCQLSQIKLIKLINVSRMSPTVWPCNKDLDICFYEDLTIFGQLLPVFTWFMLNWGINWEFIRQVEIRQFGWKVLLKLKLNMYRSVIFIVYVKSSYDFCCRWNGFCTAMTFSPRVQMLIFFLREIQKWHLNIGDVA